jgi:hypothetical protein
MCWWVLRCISVLCWSNKANQQGLGRLGAATFIMDAVNTHINTSTPSQQPQGNATKAAWEGAKLGRLEATHY